MARRPHRLRKRSVELPRQGELTTTIEVVRAAEKTVEETAGILKLAPQIIRYHRMNARILGLFDAQDHLNPEGAALMALPEHLRLARLYYAFEASEVGRMWLHWADVRTLEELNPKSAEAFLASLRGDEAPNTTWAQYESTLRRWATDLIAARRQMHLPPQARPLNLEAPPEPVVFDRGGSRAVVRALSAMTSKVDVATGYFNLDGYRELAENLDHADLRLLIGRDDTSRDQVKELLKRFRASLDRELVMRLEDKRRLVDTFHVQTIRGNIRIRALEARERGALHAKVYIFGRAAAYVTSANLTGGAFFRNIEAGCVLRERRQIQYLQERFDELFKEALPIEEKILREIERSALALGLQDPYLVFLKILLELFGRVDALVSEHKYALAEFQKAIVASVLARFESRRGLLLIAPTGLGKTVMAAYSAKVMLERGQIARVTLVCKNEVMRSMWERTLRSFQITPQAVRVFDLERTDLELDDSPALSALVEVFRDLRPNDLVIVDECHHFRNAMANRSDSLRTFLRGAGRDDGRPFSLLLTATPVSTGVENLNTLLGLVSDTELKDLADLADCEGAINVTLGAILHQFGLPGANGYRALQLQENQLFFPRVKTVTRRYESAATPIFRALDEYRHALGQVALKPADLREFVGDADLEVSGDIASGLLISLLARLAESSLPALLKCLGGLLGRARAGLLPAPNPGALIAALQKLENLATRAAGGADTKLSTLLELLDETDTREKILVFSEFIATVEYLRDALRSHFGSQRRIATLTGKDSVRERQDCFQRFAPEAQRVPRPAPARELDILVASDAISEGENLQDARIVINFDLPWTPLKLIQRVGRVDRFVSAPREIEVNNFFPSGSEYEAIVELWSRLLRRDGEASAVSGFSSIGDHHRIPEALATSAVSSQWLRQIAANTVDLEQLRTDNRLPPTRLFDLLWGARASDREAADNLPDGVQAVTVGRTPGVYLLLRDDTNTLALFFPADEANIWSAPQPHSHEYLLTRIDPPKRSMGSTGRIPGNIDPEISDALARWTTTSPPGSLDGYALIAALKVVPESAGGGLVRSQGPHRGRARQLSLLDF
ncbi:helicase-related protein [Nannocystis radixulma]|uniref:Helicase-related protein n=1 Tax=Nannocystis radixulma TaxID=2995305 RepID=A0ABT5BH79_9BACT|nr:helicase-related protein [Nannocystis radixulma]MDC0673496.1 helicase-related protein [Nannocystis radixulma]